MDDARLVDRPHRLGQAEAETQERPGVQGPPGDDRGQRGAADVFHDQPDPPLEALDAQGTHDRPGGQGDGDAVLVVEPDHFGARWVLAPQELDHHRLARGETARPHQHLGSVSTSVPVTS